MNKVEENCKYQCLRKIKFKEIFDFQLIYVRKSKCWPSLKFMQTFKGLEMVPGSVSVYLVYLASQLKNHWIPQPWTFTIPASPVNKN